MARTAHSLILGAWLACAVAAAAQPPVEVREHAAAFVDAARSRDRATIDRLLAADGRTAVTQRSADGTTALHWAVYNDDADLVQRLLKSGADPNARNDYLASPLLEAAVTGNVQVIRALVKAGADVETANADGQTALMTLARTSNVEAARVLLERGAKVDAREGWRGQTALMWAAAEAQPAMVRLLIQRGADVNARSTVNNWERQVTAEPRMQARPAGGFTPLLYAARRGCTDCARELLKAGATVDLADPENVTPLILALVNGNFDTAEVLIDAGAELDRWDTWGRSAVYAAVDMNTLPTSGRADRPSADRNTGLDILRKMLAKGANPNLQLKLFPPYRSLRDDRGADNMLTVGATALIRAAKAGDLPAMELLLAHGARTDIATARGFTALLAAAGNGSAGLDTRGRYKTEAQAVAAVRLLLDHGADINVADGTGQTALHGAVAWGWNSLIETLAGKGIDLFAKDARGRTAADLAKGTTSTSGREGGIRARPETEALLRRLMDAHSTPATTVASTL